MAGLGTRSAIERAEIGNSRPKVARACVLLDPVWPLHEHDWSRCQPPGIRGGMPQEAKAWGHAQDTLT